MIVRRWACAALAVAALLAGCSKPADKTSTPDVINFSILSAEDQASMGKVWQPLLDDLQKQTGLKVKAFYASNYTALIEAMRFNQVQAGWFSALPSLEAVNRANAEVLGRIVSGDGSVTYQSVLITKKGSGITLDDVLKCGKRYDFGIGDARSTSGTLAPAYYLFAPKGIEPADCFKTVRSASHQANLFAVANGLVQVASNNTEGLLFARRSTPEVVDKVQVIWTSPPLPESAILARKDLDPAVKDKLRKFFTNYGSAQGAEGDHERQVLKMLTYAGFKPADDSYLDPVRLMLASNDLSDARHSGDAAKVAAAQKAFDDVKALVASRAKGQPAQ
jgi:phosphonate transport system substrate-binding protein